MANTVDNKKKYWWENDSIPEDIKQYLFNLDDKIHDTKDQTRLIINKIDEITKKIDTIHTNAKLIEKHTRIQEKFWEVNNLRFNHSFPILIFILGIVIYICIK